MEAQVVNMCNLPPTVPRAAVPLKEWSSLPDHQLLYPFRERNTLRLTMLLDSSRHNKCILHDMLVCQTEQGSSSQSGVQCRHHQSLQGRWTDAQQPFLFIRRQSTGAVKLTLAPTNCQVRYLEAFTLSPSEHSREEVPVPVARGGAHRFVMVRKERFDVDRPERYAMQMPFPFAQTVGISARGWTVDV